MFIDGSVLPHPLVLGHEISGYVAEYAPLLNGEPHIHISQLEREKV
jgi:hypothetical protein